MKKRFLTVITAAVLMSLTACDLTISRPSNVSPASSTADASGIPSSSNPFTDVTSGNPSSEDPTSVSPTSVDPTSESTQPPTIDPSTGTSVDSSTSSGSSTSESSSVDPTSQSSSEQPTSQSSSEQPTSQSSSEQPTSQSSSEQPTSQPTSETTQTPVVINVTGVALSASSIEVSAFSSYNLAATVSPAEATNKAVKWSSSDNNIAIVDSNGQVTGIAAGTAKITVTTVDGGKTASCDVTVKEQVHAVTGVSLDITSYSLDLNEQKKLTATVAPNNATNKNVSWSSSNPTVAAVDSSGNVTGLTVGSAVITVTTQDGNKTAQCNITVYDSSYTPTVSVTSVTISPTTLSLDVGANSTLTHTVLPTTATNPNVTWSSSNNSVATVNNGVVTAVAAGSATITVETEDGGKQATCAVTVKAPAVTGHAGTLEDPFTAEDAVAKADEIKSTSTTTTDDAYYVKGTVKAFSETFNSSYGNFSFTIEENGKTFTGWRLKNGSSLTAFTSASDLEVGDTVVMYGKIVSFIKDSTYTPEINGTASYGGYIVSISKEPVAVTGISVNPTTATVGIGETTSLTATVLPSNADNKNYTWTSENSAIATVSSTGVVTGVAAGTVNILATTEEGSHVASCAVTVTAPVSATSISVNPTTATIKVGGTTTISATVLPSNATDKSVTWSTSNSAVATVSNGVVTGVAVGTATITAKSANNLTTSATITVEAASTPTEGDEYTITFKSNSSLGSSELTSTTFSAEIESGSEYYASFGSASKAYAGTNGIKLGSSSAGGSFEFNLSSAVTSNNATSVSYTVASYSSDSTQSTLIVNGETVSTNASSGTFTYELSTAAPVTSVGVGSTSKRLYVQSITISCVPATPTDPTGISIPSTAEVGINGSTTLKVTYSPSGCNQNKGVTWKSSNTSVATVDSSGVVKGVAAGTAVITATSTFNSSFTSSCSVTVTEVAKDKWTILLYLCGADLESESQLASGDLTEIKSVASQPDDVNIVVEAGGANSWSSTYSSVIDASKLNRFHLQNKSYVKDEQITYASMGLSSTLQSFLEWGVETYPAEKYGVILWNHGGGQRGVCYDEKKNDDSLTDNEVVSAVKNAQSSTGCGKMEFIGYDACLMQLMEVAEFNSPYFNYQIASQESEAGYGWDYDTWVDDLFANKSTTVILQAICDGFIKDNGGATATGETYQGTYYPADQTLSYLDLSQMASFKTAWESMASALSSKITSSNKSSFNSNVIGKTKYFGGSDYDYFCTFDAYHFLTILENNSTFNPGSSYISACKTAFNNLVKYNIVQKEAAHDAYGLCFYYTAGTGYSQSNYNSSTYSNFTNWIKVANNGGSLTSSYSY